ncbi:uncharacterized protein LOC119271574 [Triticum dicoccoides]|uniref:uncharacterized protein LOC119271574 n=1 Tax=Triticum dicoccoides TaxID=85692 RepID=UPI00188ECB1F|nr:uncharacterized protein LOC119271574 [Triticum dicoccoides]
MLPTVVCTVAMLPRRRLPRRPEGPYASGRLGWSVPRDDGQPLVARRGGQPWDWTPVDLHMLDENKGTEDHGQSREAVTPCLSHLFRWLSTAPALGAQHGGTRHGSSIVWSLDATAHCPAS